MKINPGLVLVLVFVEGSKDSLVGQMPTIAAISKSVRVIILQGR